MIAIFHPVTMHELGIASSILDSVQAVAERHPGTRITKVGVRVGEISAVDPGSLQSALSVW
jgi:Zn finger protein HypA/HybF involved in hydrogenase expression